MEIILGATISVLLQLIKGRIPGEWAKIGVLLVMCVGAAGLYTALVSVGYWETVANILMVAGAFYTFVIQRFEK